jgi:glutathione S-transferase
MTNVIVYGFPISTFVNIVRLVLTFKNVAFDFHDLEPEMGGPAHLALHPFNRVPILDHAGFRVYETSAIALYVDETFFGPALQPRELRSRARMYQFRGRLNQGRNNLRLRNIKGMTASALAHLGVGAAGHRPLS